MRSWIPGVLAALCLMAWNGSVHAEGKNPEQFKKCLQICLDESSGCSKENRHNTLCRDHKSVCIDRCDPRREYKETTEMLFPTKERVINTPRNQMTPQDREALCRQNCDLSMHTCVQAGNGSSLCSSTRRGCQSRCEQNPR